MTSQVLFTVDEAAKLIATGKPLLVAGDERLLRELPTGPWIGGTIPYFIVEEGGVCSRDLLYITRLPSTVADARIQRYDSKTIEQVYVDGAGSDLSFILIPAQSQTHLQFALRAPTLSAFACRPLVGWVTGVHLSELDKTKPKVVDGRSGEALEDGALVLRLRLATGEVADIGILNIFTPGDGPDIELDGDGFSVREALIDGVRHNLAEWLTSRGVDTKLPLVADYLGSHVNVAVQRVDADNGVVDFYAPVFAGVTYRTARPIGDYVREFTQRLPQVVNGEVVFACNCILNYLYSKLEGRRTGPITGPVTFGEIAYQLLNQTLAYVTISTLRP